MDSTQSSTHVSRPTPAEVPQRDPIADAASEMEERDVALQMVNALRAGFDEFERLVAASRANAERMLLDVEAWARDGVVPPRARRYAALVRSEGDLDEDSFCDFDIHQVASVALHGVGMGDVSYFVAALKEMGDMWSMHNDLYMQAGDAARAAFVASAQNGGAR